jgi:glucosamine-6-phosphate deaminase
MRILVTPEYQTLSQTAADLVINAIRNKPDLCLALPTGSTPIGMYEEIVRQYREQHLDFSGVRTFNLDEYLDLAPDHPQSFHTYMRRQFFDHVNILPANIDIPNGTRGIDAEAESERYERNITRVGGIDLLIVGIAANAHIAFNEPGSAVESRTRAVDLAPETIANAQLHFGNEPAPTRAITMGIGTMLEARRVLLLASGAGKADAVKRALRGPITPAVPASALQLHSSVIAILDEAAAPGEST